MSTRMRKIGTAVGKVFTKHGTTILVTLGIISEGVALYEMYKAADLVKAKIEEVNKDLELETELSTPKKVVKQVVGVAPTLAKPAAWYLFGSTCIAVAHRADTKRIAALATAYEFSETARRETINKVREKFGEKKAKEIEDEYYQEQAQKNMPSGPRDASICITGHGDQLYFDEGSSRFFRASPQWLEKCKVDISHQVFCDNYASVNDFYYILGIPACGLGNLGGWESTHDLDSDSLIDMRWDVRAGTSDWGETYGFLTYWPKSRYKL